MDGEGEEKRRNRKGKWDKRGGEGEDRGEIEKEGGKIREEGGGEGKGEERKEGGVANPRRCFSSCFGVFASIATP